MVDWCIRLVTPTHFPHFPQFRLMKPMESHIEPSDAVRLWVSKHWRTSLQRRRCSSKHKLQAGWVLNRSGHITCQHFKIPATPFILRKLMPQKVSQLSQIRFLTVLQVVGSSSGTIADSSSVYKFHLSVLKKPSQRSFLTNRNFLKQTQIKHTY